MPYEREQDCFYRLPACGRLFPGDAGAGHPMHSSADFHLLCNHHETRLGGAREQMDRWMLKCQGAAINRIITHIARNMNIESIDISNMCSHLQKKLFEEDGTYHHLWIAMQDDPELTAVGRSRQLHIYRNGKKVLILAGKAAPKVIREDRLCEILS